ncbi:hypothetical protein EIN_486010 [Entamoeba invadens IP1]|uniref:Uncharacterized protein n=1 Tax=Entamoeba invadens IP1 TaxID=370355 RepID=A0A0A1U4S4_ENTIV|nr:hypothetical protein EIN_486010 [Entamoeba invadens IP1]ELP89199.1 hypothetical protein EIN_486010 [Entamoeba invadens IP1]|eukprot:XP_004255970.1 hypothetical protein EIN_486010 [Entamoeba invadens IP1]
MTNSEEPLISDFKEIEPNRDNTNIDNIIVIDDENDDASENHSDFNFSSQQIFVLEDQSHHTTRDLNKQTNSNEQLKQVKNQLTNTVAKNSKENTLDKIFNKPENFENEIFKSVGCEKETFKNSEILTPFKTQPKFDEMKKTNFNPQIAPPPLISKIPQIVKTPVFGTIQKSQTTLLLQEKVKEHQKEKSLIDDLMSEMNNLPKVKLIHRNEEEQFDAIPDLMDTPLKAENNFVFTWAQSELNEGKGVALNVLRDKYFAQNGAFQSEQDKHDLFEKEMTKNGFKTITTKLEFSYAVRPEQVFDVFRAVKSHSEYSDGDFVYIDFLDLFLKDFETTEVVVPQAWGEKGQLLKLTRSGCYYRLLGGVRGDGAVIQPVVASKSIQELNALRELNCFVKEKDHLDEEDLVEWIYTNFTSSLVCFYGTPKLYVVPDYFSASVKKVIEKIDEKLRRYFEVLYIPDEAVLGAPVGAISKNVVNEIVKQSVLRK